MQITGETDLFSSWAHLSATFRAPIMFNDYFASKGHNFSCAGLHVLPEIWQRLSNWCARRIISKGFASRFRTRLTRCRCWTG